MLSKKWLIVALICLSPVFHLVRAEDATDDEEGTVAEEAPAQDPMDTKDKNAEDEDEEIKASPDAEVYVLFTKPAKTKDFPAGAPIRFLISFANKGEQMLTINNIDTSFRYPMDFNFVIRNYSMPAPFNKQLQAGHETSFENAFIAAEEYAGRPLGLVIKVNYMDEQGKLYSNAVFNETVHIVEDESGFNPETGFLYLVFACLFVLALLLGQQFLNKMRRKHGISSSSASKSRAKQQAPVEVGTKNQERSDIDFEWIPREVLKSANKSPGRSPPGSAKQRRVKPRVDDE